MLLTEIVLTIHSFMLKAKIPLLTFKKGNITQYFENGLAISPVLSTRR